MNSQINVYVVLIILTIHWVADYVVQLSKWQLGKSESLSCLFSHTGAYICTTWTMGFIILTIYNKGQNSWEYGNLFIFCAITFVIHTIQDFFTSKLNSYLKRFNYNKEFWVSVSFDQLLHYVQLLITYQLLFK